MKISKEKLLKKGNKSLAAGGLLSIGVLACPSGPCIFCAAPSLLLMANGLLAKIRKR